MNELDRIFYRFLVTLAGALWGMVIAAMLGVAYSGKSADTSMVYGWLSVGLTAGGIAGWLLGPRRR